LFAPLAIPFAPLAVNFTAKFAKVYRKVRKVLFSVRQRNGKFTKLFPECLPFSNITYLGSGNLAIE